MHDLQHYLKRLRLSDQVPAGANQPEHAENLEEHVYMYAIQIEEWQCHGRQYISSISTASGVGCSRPGNEGSG